MREIVIKVRDDLDHSQQADQTRFIGIDGVWYMADLTELNGKVLDEFLHPYIEHATRLGGQPVSTEIREHEPKFNLAGIAEQGTAEQSANKLQAARDRNKRIREWGKKTAHANNPSFARGYIPVGLREDYAKTHPDDPAPTS